MSGLQRSVASTTRVAAEEQVLLVSGGQVLDPEKPLASYSGAGTEANPVFLVSRNVRLQPGALPFDGDEAAEIKAGLRELEAQLEADGQEGARLWVHLTPEAVRELELAAGAHVQLILKTNSIRVLSHSRAQEGGGKSS